MTGYHVTKRALQTEAHRWQKELDTPEVKGIRIGLQIARRIVDECSLLINTREKRLTSFKLKWTAAQFASGIRSAHSKLEGHCYEHAKNILANAIKRGMSQEDGNE